MVESPREVLNRLATLCPIQGIHCIGINIFSSYTGFQYAYS